LCLLSSDSDADVIVYWSWYK